MPHTLQAAPAERGLVPIHQEFVGELTGSVAGHVMCFGYAKFKNICIFLNMGGPRMSVEAIRAKMSVGDTIKVFPPNSRYATAELGSGSKDDTGMYTPYMSYLPEAKFANVILVHEMAVNPNYEKNPAAFIFRVNEAQASAMLRHHVSELVNVAVFDEWDNYLYSTGRQQGLVYPAPSEGGVDVLTVLLDADAWTTLIANGLRDGVIWFPR